MPFLEAVNRMLQAYQGEPGKPSRFVLSVVKEESTGRTYVRTRTGEHPIEPSFLEGMKQAGPVYVFASKSALDRGEEPIQVDSARGPRQAVSDGSSPVTRHVPAEVIRRLTARDGGLCVFPRCRRIAMSRHHTERFEVDPGHDPARLRSLCEEHHSVVHASLVANEPALPSDWKTRPMQEGGTQSPPNDSRSVRDRTDRRYQRYRSRSRPRPIEG